MPSATSLVDVPVDFQTYVANEWAALHRFAYSVTGDNEAAKDAVQDALVHCYPRWARIASGNPAAYIRRSIVNAYIDAWRKTARMDAVTDIDDLVPPVSDGADARANADLVWRLCARLPVRQRAALVLRYVEDRGYGEIAEICQVTEQTARSHVRHALAAIKANLSVRSTDV